MPETTATAGATGAEAGATGEPFKVFQTQAEFDAHAAKIRHEAERKARTVSADERATMDAMAADLETRKQRDLEAAGNYDKAKQAIEAAAKERVDKATAGIQGAHRREGIAGAGAGARCLRPGRCHRPVGRADRHR
jgi:hypothetical protein